MAHGKLRANFAVFLKQKFGIGHLTVQVKKVAGAAIKECVKHLVCRHIESAEIHNTEVQAEVHFDLPVDASEEFPALFAALEKMKREQLIGGRLWFDYAFLGGSIPKIGRSRPREYDPNNENSVSLEKLGGSNRRTMEATQEKPLV